MVIVGGGTAGWLSAAVLAAGHGADRPDGLRVTLVESPGVAPIGVGEGTWPTMRDTLRGIGVSEADFVRECDVAFKQGSRFDRWVTGAADDRYHHPFMLPQGHGEADLVGAWLERHADAPFAETVCVQPQLCAFGRAPKQPGTPEFAAVANYGYHLDAGRFAPFLQRHCLQRLGVRHVADHVTGLDVHESGDIAALRLQAGEPLAGDLFVDCTGLHARLLGGHYGVPFVPRRDVLFNDRALAVQVPYGAPDAPIATQTIATAQACGWTWDIGLPTRRGVGYVYSSAHTSDDEAHAVLSAHLGGVDVAARQLGFEPGYRREFWHRNCVAIGLSAGFIEPLEASAIALVELSAAMLDAQLPATREDMDRVARRFNATFTHRWARIVDFLKLHYVLSRRDGAYWRDHRDSASIPDRLHELLALWRHRAPSRYELDRADEVFPSASWQYILYGMGHRPQPSALATRPEPRRLAQAHFADVGRLGRRLLGGLPAHRDLIDAIHQQGLRRAEP
ncbi:tryptophan halogenase family protein [Lysobacter humi (ex Lee et al. 2017)]